MHSSESHWQKPPEHLSLSSSEVHVWRAKLDSMASNVQTLVQILSSDEQARAGQFRFQQDRSHYIIARGILRSILGRYLYSDPHILKFSYSQQGKPTLVQDQESDRLFFNVTHSHGMALYALARSPGIGIDLEYLDTKVSYEQIAEQFFSPLEIRMLRAVPKEMQRVAFFSCWTRKEAYVKARGLGLSLALNQFDVSMTPGEPAALLATREESLDISKWSLYDLFPGPGYVAAIAFEGHPARVMRWQWQE